MLIYIILNVEMFVLPKMNDSFWQIASTFKYYKYFE